MTNHLVELSTNPDTAPSIQLGLLAQWGALNGVKLTRAGFWLSDLATGRARSFSAGGRWGPSGWQLEEGARWPWRDHYAYFKVGRAPAAIVTQPYDWPEAEAKLRALVARLELVIQTPPNPKASFWYPGHANFVVLTGPSFGEVKWTDEQLAFPGETP